MSRGECCASSLELDNAVSAAAASWRTCRALAGVGHRACRADAGCWELLPLVTRAKIAPLRHPVGVLGSVDLGLPLIKAMEDTEVDAGCGGNYTVAVELKECPPPLSPPVALQRLPPARLPALTEGGRAHHQREPSRWNMTGQRAVTGAIPSMGMVGLECVGACRQAGTFVA